MKLFKIISLFYVFDFLCQEQKNYTRLVFHTKITLLDKIVYSMFLD